MVFSNVVLGEQVGGNYVIKNKNMLKSFLFLITSLVVENFLRCFGTISSTKQNNYSINTI